MSKKNQNFQNIIIHYLNNIDMPKSSRVELNKKNHYGLYGDTYNDFIRD